MKRARVPLFTTVIASLSLLLGVAPAQASHSWGNYHWARTANPLPLEVLDSMTDDWQSSFDGTIAAWNTSAVLDLTVVNGGDDNKTRKRCNAPSGKIRVCNANYGQNGWLGLASINLDSNGHITKGVAKMNDSYGWYYDQTPGEDNHVTCQEVGHLFGLGHTSEDGTSQGTCMDYSSSPASQWPNQHDFDQLAAMYAHLDSYNTYASSDGGSGGGDPKPCRGPAWKCGSGSSASGRDFGELVRANVHEEVWVRRTAGGEIVLTHVRLAP